MSESGDAAEPRQMNLVNFMR